MIYYWDQFSRWKLSQNYEAHVYFIFVIIHILIVKEHSPSWKWFRLLIQTRIFLRNCFINQCIHSSYYCVIRQVNFILIGAGVYFSNHTRVIKLANLELSRFKNSYGVPLRISVHLCYLYKPSLSRICQYSYVFISNPSPNYNYPSPADPEIVAKNVLYSSFVNLNFYYLLSHKRNSTTYVKAIYLSLI